MAPRTRDAAAIVTLARIRARVIVACGSEDLQELHRIELTGVAFSPDTLVIVAGDSTGA